MNRITIMLDDKLERRLRDYQAKTIKDSGANFSFSACLNEILEKGLK